MDALHLLQILGNGHLIEDMYAAIRETAAEVTETGNSGSVSISIKLFRPKGADEHMVEMDTQVRRAPALKDPRATWVMSFDGDLFRQDPRQTQLDFRSIDGGTPEPRVIDQPPQETREISS